MTLFFDGFSLAGSKPIYKPKVQSSARVTTYFHYKVNSFCQYVCSWYPFLHPPHQHKKNGAKEKQGESVGEGKNKEEEEKEGGRKEEEEEGKKKKKVHSLALECNVCTLMFKIIIHDIEPFFCVAF